MGRVSTRQNKNIYQRTREELGLTREKAEAMKKYGEAAVIEMIMGALGGKLAADPAPVVVVPPTPAQPVRDEPADET